MKNISVQLKRFPISSFPGGKFDAKCIFCNEKKHIEVIYYYHITIMSQHRTTGTHVCQGCYDINKENILNKIEVLHTIKYL